ncbi:MULTISPECIES: hypothetical protein [unclassified Bosea (in: a-proteobacteria)]|uniref:hypothetical protein n=1 Tax=unclassified Bosea (in: a-proteobacteria) TaxID=2653178 RepID=UPI000F7F77C4|nr:MULTISPECIES: hypothetical protein [unclassified Bosea (in: a-proteobacteria)]
MKRSLWSKVPAHSSFTNRLQNAAMERQNFVAAIHDYEHDCRSIVAFEDQPMAKLTVFEFGRIEEKIARSPVIKVAGELIQDLGRVPVAQVQITFSGNQSVSPLGGVRERRTRSCPKAVWRQRLVH